jgi:hypothetical protein
MQVANVHAAQATDEEWIDIESEIVSGEKGFLLVVFL